jgi:hypothetical protein
MVCQTCQFQPQCLEQALGKNERHGLWANANQRERQQLMPTFRQRAHDFDPHCEDPTCAWCPAVRDHVYGERSGPININGAGARHGMMSTYARGCRCPRCRLRASVPGRRLAKLGVDVASWWDAWFGTGEPADIEELRLARAKLLAEFDAAEAA